MTARKHPHADDVPEAKHPKHQKPQAAWEYLVYYGDLTDHDEPETHTKFQEAVNEFGAEGWELVGVAGGATWTRCFFKRPATAEATHDAAHEVASEEEG